MEKHAKILKLTAAQWVQIGIDAGWIERKAALLDLLQEMTGNTYQTNAVGMSTNMVGNVLQQNQSSQQFANTLHQYFGQMQRSLDQDLVTMRNLDSKSPRMQRIQAMLTTIKNEVDRGMPELEALKKELMANPMGDMTAEQVTALQTGTQVGTSNMPAPAVEGVLGK